jgi:hypothetical protein
MDAIRGTTLAVVAVSLAGCAHHAHVADAPRIVPWKYVDDGVKAVETTSARYRFTERHPRGMRLMTHPCGKYGDCWRGYAYDDCTSLMISAARRIDSYLSFGSAGVDYRVLRTRGYRIGPIGFGDGDALLLCF